MDRTLTPRIRSHCDDPLPPRQERIVRNDGRRRLAAPGTANPELRWGRGRHPVFQGHLDPRGRLAGERSARPSKDITEPGLDTVPGSS